MIQNVDKRSLGKELRFAVINSTVNVEARSVKLYDLIENDLLGPLDLQSRGIAPYRYGGPLLGSWTSSSQDE